MIKINLNFCCLLGVFNILVYLESKSILSTTCLHVYYVDYVFLKEIMFYKTVIFVSTKTKVAVNRYVPLQKVMSIHHSM